MCGIVGYVGKDSAKSVIVDGLKRLEYRGYDSSGVALLTPERIVFFKRSGKIRSLERELRETSIDSHVGIGHTRWATHGAPDDRNAHPHGDCDGRIAVVHNGIIENFVELRKELQGKGHKFSSETDSEVIAHLIEEEFKRRENFFEAFSEAVKRLKGSYAVAVVTTYDPAAIFVARKDSPLVIGVGKGEMFVASDVPAFLPYTSMAVFLEDFELARISSDGYEVFDFEGNRKVKEEVKIPWSLAQAEKAGFKHFMLKEIFEQPRAVADTLSGNLSWVRGDTELYGIDPKCIDKICIVACGTSYHAGLIGEFYLENFAIVPVEVDYASEFRYRNPVIDSRTLVVAISQSGETADTLAAVRLASEKGAKVLSICNVIGSSITRESDTVVYTYAGPEISVASTKAFTTQLVSLFLFSLWLGRQRGVLDSEQFDSLLREALELPSNIELVLNREKERGEIKRVADTLHKISDVLYLGRHVNYPIALEGALKFKEITYIHAEGYPAGEMKHGPIALIDETMRVIAVATKGRVYEKIVSNLQEVKSRKGILISLTNEGCREVEDISDMVITVPEVDEFISPVVNVVPLQLLAYYVADYLGYDVDQPRNLAKSVTVE